MLRRFLCVFPLLATLASSEQAQSYPWIEPMDEANRLEARLAPPSGFQRVAAQDGSFAAWLRGLPLKEGTPQVLLFDGQPKGNQEAHVAVVDLDVGKRDLQQCADAAIRLRAEYLYSRGQTDRITFHFTSGDEASLARWNEGYRPKVHGNKVEWSKSASSDSSYRAFRSYLDTVFTYAGTRSLAREMTPVPDLKGIAAGDVFVQGGSPGHAVIVVDVAEEASTGRRVFLLAQGFMPAQQVHVLKNPSDAALSPWYDAALGDVLETPEWTFQKGDLKRF